MKVTGHFISCPLFGGNEETPAEPLGWLTGVLSWGAAPAYRAGTLGGMERKLGNIFIVCVCALTGLTIGGVFLSNALLGFVLTPVCAVLGYKYAREMPDSPE